MEWASVISAIIGIIAGLITHWLKGEADRRKREKEDAERKAKERADWDAVREDAKKQTRNVMAEVDRNAKLRMLAHALQFKDPKLKAELDAVTPLMREVVEAFAIYSWSKFNTPAVITRIFEPVEGESGVHQTGRAVDLRFEHAGRTLYSLGDAMELVAYINSRFPRTDGFRTAILHSFNGGPKHFHLQVPVKW